MIRFSEDDQVLQEPFAKQNVPNSSFQLVRDTYWTKKFYILSRDTLVATTLTKVALFEGVQPGILQRKYLSFSIVNYVSSSQAEVSEFVTLYRHLKRG